MELIIIVAMGLGALVLLSGLASRVGVDSRWTVGDDHRRSTI
ncbi:MAG: hypothetical protein WCH74_04135 [Chloroflexota bacterium]